MKRLRYALFGVYIFFVLWLTLIDRQYGECRAMLVPFWEFVNVIKGVERSFYIKQILGNLALLMPLGFMLPIMRKVTVKQVFVIALCFSCFIELVQYITGRGLMEFDDVFNNTVGAVLGYKVYDVLRERI
ncbi:MAG: VanZ family protein [Ruminococcus sp.]|nr:VanZ family protein [Ruminococcus sp.]